MKNAEIRKKFNDPRDHSEFTIKQLCDAGALDEKSQRAEAMMNGISWEYYSQIRISRP